MMVLMPPRCDTLLINATLLTLDRSFTIHRSGAVAIAGDSIAAVGPGAETYAAADTIDCGGRVVMPGLVNAHTHVPMTLLRGLADDLRLDVWLMGYMMPVEREFVSPDFVRLGTRLGCAEMIRSGVTCFADMYYFEEAIAEATAEAGMRALCGQTVLRFPTPDATSYEDSLARARDFIERWRGHPLVVPAPAPHAPYTCTPDILRSCAELAAEFDVPLHIHLSETALEVEASRRVHGMPVVPWVKKQGLFGAKVLAAHCVHVDDGEIRALKNFDAGVAHNPTAVYAQVVYAAESTDVVDVRCNGRWLMRDRALLPLDEAVLRAAAGGEAARIDTFLSSREANVLQKLVAVGGAVEQESFEVQVKARVPSESQVLSVIKSKQLTVVRSSHYHQFDTYWSFED